jgi:hypothetical protein
MQKPQKRTRRIDKIETESRLITVESCEDRIARVNSLLAQGRLLADGRPALGKSAHITDVPKVAPSTFATIVLTGFRAGSRVSVGLVERSPLDCNHDEVGQDYHRPNCVVANHPQHRLTPSRHAAQSRRSRLNVNCKRSARPKIWRAATWSSDAQGQSGSGSRRRSR